MKFGLIVEGHGDASALPILLRRSLAMRGIHHVEIPQPLRLPRSKIVKRDELARAVEFMASRSAPDGRILVVLDADDDCPASLAPQLSRWVHEARPDRPSSVILANAEFEAWFLAGAASLRSRRGLPADLASPPDPERIRDAKGWLSERMPQRYSETLDQPALAAVVDLEQARSAPSFDKFQRDLDRLCGISATAWPA